MTLRVHHIFLKWKIMSKLKCSNTHRKFWATRAQVFCVWAERHMLVEILLRLTHIRRHTWISSLFILFSWFFFWQDHITFFHIPNLMTDNSSHAFVCLYNRLQLFPLKSINLFYFNIMNYFSLYFWISLLF